MTLISRKASNLQAEAFELILKCKDIRDVRNKLCEFFAANQLHLKQPPKKRTSSMSIVGSESSMQKSSSIGSVKEDKKLKNESGNNTVNFFK
jgi:hypothetical protein